jgi:hypothetical protein
VFVVLSAGLFGVVWGFFPETKGHGLEEIATVFKGDQAAVRNTIPEIAGKGVGRGICMLRKPELDDGASHGLGVMVGSGSQLRTPTR